MKPTGSSISFLIPTWNGRELLEKYLDGNLEIIGRELDEWEVIVIDNGSTDGTVAYLRKAYAGKPVRVLALPKYRVWQRA